MKKLLLIPALMGLCSALQAETRLINGDGSDVSQLCIAAAESGEAFNALAANLGNPASLKEELRCNGMTLTTFVRRIREERQERSVAYVFKAGDDSDLSSLCLAATRSEEDYQQTLETLFGDERRVEESVSCNGMPLKAFKHMYQQDSNVLISAR